MANTANKIIKMAESQLGVTESPKGSNKQKYGEAYGWNGVQWCVIFVWWNFMKCGMSALFGHGKKFASCGKLIEEMKSDFHKGTDGLKPGDIVFFDFDSIKDADHVGICTAVNTSKKTVESIDGNTGSGNEANGGQVQRRTREFKKVYGYIRPHYDAEPKPAPAPTVPYSYAQFEKDVRKILGISSSAPIDTVLSKTPEISVKKNVNHKLITPWERLLKQLGYYTGVIEEDKGNKPNFGSGMESAVRKFQKNVCKSKGELVDGKLSAKGIAWKTALRK